MKRKEWQELQKKPVTDLRKNVVEEREHLRTLRFELAAGKVKNVQEIRQSRKLIARLLTLLKKQEAPTR